MKEALKLALYELEGIPVYRKYGVRISNAITAIKEALAQPDYRAVKTYHEGKPVYVSQPEQEPVACDCRLQADECNGDTATFHPFQVGASCSTRLCERVYTTPPKRPWVGLTDEEIESCANWRWMTTCRAIEAKLKEKNT